jgi:hypothetical protein
MAAKHCMNCGAGLNIHPTDAIITCNYCGTSFTPDGTRMKEHFALGVNYTQSDALDTLKAYLVKVPGVADNLAEKIQLRDLSMTYYPYWTVTVQGDVTYKGIDRKASFRGQSGGRYSSIHWEWVAESGHQEQTRQIRLYAGPKARPEVVNYPIATRSRKYFNFEEVQQYTGNVLFSKVSAEEARQQATQATRNMIYSRIKRETEKIDDARETFQVTDQAYIHVPIYHIKFSVGGGKTYEAALDASNGRVIYSQIPTTTSFKIQTIGMSLFWLLLTIGGAALTYLAYSGVPLLGLTPEYLFYAGIGLTIIPFVLALMTIYYARRKTAAERAQ